MPAHVTRYPSERHLPEKRDKNRGDRTEGQLSIGNFNCHNNLACFANTLNLLYINCLEDAGAGCNAGYNNLAMNYIAGFLVFNFQSVKERLNVGLLLLYYTNIHRSRKFEKKVISPIIYGLPK